MNSILPLSLFFRRTSSSGPIAAENVKRQKEKFDLSRIRCPLCQWQPRKSDLWGCGDCGYPEFFTGGCGTFWNTFATGGKCPGCGYQWRWTSCLKCDGWSRHEDWYAEETN